MERMRIDKWLWAARFFKTRSQAAEAVRGGKVHVEGQRVKPSREIMVGTSIEICKGPYRWEVVVTGLSDKRRSAKEARLLYRETPESAKRRKELAERLKIERLAFMTPSEKPDKKARRRLQRIKRGI